MKGLWYSGLGASLKKSRPSLTCAACRSVSAGSAGASKTRAMRFLIVERIPNGLAFSPMKRCSLFLFSLGWLIMSLATVALAQSLPGEWKHQDIGGVEVKGSATFERGVFTLQGTLDTWGTNDGFQFVWQPWRGDGQIVARVVTVANTSNHAKAGVMFRDSLAADARHAQACVTPVDGAQFLTRTETGGKTVSAKTGADKGKLPYWVKLVRAGDRFSGFESADGAQWRLIGATNVPMSAQVYVGLTTSSHQKTNLCQATLDHVTVKK